MIVLLTLMACGSSPQSSPTARPDGVPESAVAIHLTARGVLVDGELAVERAAFEENLADGINTAVLQAIPPEGKDAWIDAPGDTPWMLVRKLLVSADEAGREARWVSSGGDAYGPSGKPDARYRPNCNGGKLSVEGISRRVSVELFAGSDGVWTEASVLFAPTIEGSAALGLPTSCWTDIDCSSTSREAACTGALGSEPAPSRVPVAGPVGCILPIRKEAGQEAEWPPELATNLEGLGITSSDEATMLIEANVPWSAAVAILEGFDRAGLPAPALGLPLVEGHGRPPLCTATVRDAATLETAAAKYLGSRVSDEPTPADGEPE